MRQNLSPATSVAPQLGQLTISLFSARMPAPPFEKSRDRFCLSPARRVRGSVLSSGGVCYEYTPSGAPQLHPARAGLRLVRTRKSRGDPYILLAPALARKRLAPPAHGVLSEASSKQ